MGRERAPVSSQETQAEQLAEAKTNTGPAQVKILVPDHQSMVALLGQRDELLKLVERAFDARIIVRGNEISIGGGQAEVQRVSLLFEELLTLLEQGQHLTEDSVSRTIDMIKEDAARPSEVLGDVLLTVRGRTLRPKTFGQKRYVDAIRKATITFGIGPAGTGKTYLAVAAAVKALQSREVSRIILTRPAVEAGERLGFLPGTLYEKIDPYLKPLYDALFDMMDSEAFSRLMERGTIEVAPLAYMRGRTLNDSFIILDEGQNTTPEQIKMFLTRLGFGSKAVVTADVTQIDLPQGQRSGAVVVEEILEGIDGIEFVRLGARDVVRHKIVQDIVEAYRAFSEHGSRPERGSRSDRPDSS
jgi:phosphate starvation-inducible protein PhoH and related proteins